MNAELFYLESQANLVTPLKDLLREHIHAGIRVDPLMIVTQSYMRGASDIGWRYVKLLQAAIPPETRLNLTVKDLETFGYRFYFEVYYTLFSSAYQSEGRKLFRDEGLAIFFPAVAIRERMILVPLGLSQRISGVEKEASLFKPFEMGGVIEVDFSDLGSLDRATSQVGKKMRQDLIKELRAYATYQNINEFNLAKIAQDFNLDLGYIQYTITTEAAQALFYQRLSCHFDREVLPINRWSKVMMMVTNDSENALANLEAHVSGPVKIRPSRIQLNLPAHSTTQIPIAIMPEEAGDFPLEIAFSLPEDKLFAEWLPTHHLWIQVQD